MITPQEALRRLPKAIERIADLEAQNAELVKALVTVIKLYKSLETASGIDYTMKEDELNREVKSAEAILSKHGEDK